jgi:hypothetical protein
MPPSGSTREPSPMLDRDFGGNSFGLGSDNASFGFGPSSQAEGEGESGRKNELDGDEDPFAHIADLLRNSTPDTIPDVFIAPKPPKPVRRRKGAAALLLLFIIILLCAAGVGLYVFQDRVIDEYPDAADYYEQIGLRNKVVGAGLAFRNTKAERLVQDQSEVLIVRGVIANTTDQPREIPLLRLALTNAAKESLQEKIISPPQTALEPHGTVGFRITLDQPNPNASNFDVSFVPAKPAVPGQGSAPASAPGPGSAH